MEKRLIKHITNAKSGIDTYFYRAIRKHGACHIVSKVLDTGTSLSEAQKKERRYVKKFKSNNPNHGYNLTKGGVGGWSVPKSKFKEWKKKVSARTTKDKNPNYSGYSDQELIRIAVEYFKTNKSLGYNEWKAFARREGYPQTFSKNRFNGSFKSFIIEVQKELKKQNIRFYKIDFYNSKNTYSKKTRLKISKSLKGRRWYNDGVRNYLIHIKDKRPDMVLGMINAKNKKT